MGGGVGTRDGGSLAFMSMYRLLAYRHRLVDGGRRGGWWWEVDRGRLLVMQNRGGGAGGGLRGGTLWRQSLSSMRMEGTPREKQQPPQQQQQPSQPEKQDLGPTIPLSASPGARYDADRLKKRFNSRRLEVTRRRMQIAVPLTAFVTRIVVDIRLRREVEMREQRAKEFFDLITKLGPAFIKAGQVLSTRSDLLPVEYLDQLQKLQDRLPPFPEQVAIAQLEAELDAPLPAIFERFDTVPVAAASIGQVYKAQLHDGSHVAVKLQRPNCEEIVAMDLYILRELSSFLSFLLRLVQRDIDLKNVVDEFGELIFEEMDYIAEGNNAERFWKLYGHDPNIRVPRVHWKFTRRRVLIMDWINGVRLTDAKPASRRRLVKILLRCSLRQMLDDGFFHADPHGGNLLETDDGKLCYLDFGMMSTLKSSQRYGIIQSVVHLVNRDWPSLVALYIKLGFLPRNVDTREIVAALDKTMPNVLNASVADFNFTSVIQELGTVMFMYPFQLPPYYTAIMRCMGVLEGVALQIDSSAKLVNSAYPFIVRKLLTDPHEELRETLTLLLFRDGHLQRARLETLLTSAADSSDAENFIESFNGFLDCLFDDRREKLRLTLAEDMAEELDAFTYDMSQYLAVRVAKTRPLQSLVPCAGSKQEPVVTKTMKDTERMLKILSRCQGLDGTFSREILRRILTEPKGREMSVIFAGSLFQRTSSRIIRSVARAVG